MVKRKKSKKAASSSRKAAHGAGGEPSGDVERLLKEILSHVERGEGMFTITVSSADTFNAAVARLRNMGRMVMASDGPIREGTPSDVVLTIL